MFDLNCIVRPCVLQLQPYSSARDEFMGTAQIFLDANENPYENGFNRYPDPRQHELKQRLSALWGQPKERIFLGNGSDEAIDLLVRVFCEPGQDRILVCPPTYGMYKVTAGVNNVGLDEVPLDEEFEPDQQQLEKALEDPALKIIFFCSPNNPTGNLLRPELVGDIARKFRGIVVVDEAYVDFAPEGSVVSLLDDNVNLVVLRTFSKAWGMAGLRLGAALADPAIIQLVNRIKPPYNINVLTQKAALEMLERKEEVFSRVEEIVSERERLREALEQLTGVERVYPSDANFLLVRFREAGRIFDSLIHSGTVVRDRTRQVAGCLRITVGTPQENRQLLNQLEQLLIPNNSIH